MVTVLQDPDALAQAKLAALAKELDEMERAICAAAGGGAKLPWPLWDVFVRLAAAAEVCESVLAAHAAGDACVRDEILAEVATTLGAVREVNLGLVRIALAALC